MSTCSISSAPRFPLPDRWRLFVAAPLPDEAAARAFDALMPLREAFPDVRWVAPHKLHLTLVFLGPTDPEQVVSIARAMARVAGAHRTLEVATGEGGGGRANQRRGGVAWLPLATGARGVSQLALELDAAIGGATYDGSHVPRPHLTVARGVSRGALTALRQWSASRPPVTWWVDRLVLLRSHGGAGGSRYEELAEAPLLRGI